jgi:hypothetical protein
VSARFPDFLIIGAMKSGTTTLYEDLSGNPRVFFPLDKEPGNLVSDTVLEPEGRRTYAALFERAEAQQLCGEASTSYTQMPEVTGCAERAHRLMGAELRLVYLVREPVARAVSHHYHEYSAGRAAPDFDAEIRRLAYLVDYGRYAMQLTPWLECFGPERVLVLRFEDFVADRAGHVRRISEFLGVEARVEAIDVDARFNVSEGKAVAVGGSKRLVNNPLYRGLLRPLLPRGLRRRLGSLLLPKAPPRPQPPAAASVDYILDAVSEDAERLRALLGRRQPFWDFDAVRRGFAARRERAD